MLLPLILIVNGVVMPSDTILRGARILAEEAETGSVAAREMLRSIVEQTSALRTRLEITSNIASLAHRRCSMPAAYDDDHCST